MDLPPKTFRETSVADHMLMMCQILCEPRSRDTYVVGLSDVGPPAPILCSTAPGAMERGFAIAEPHKIYPWPIYSGQNNISPVSIQSFTWHQLERFPRRSSGIDKP